MNKNIPSIHLTDFPEKITIKDTSAGKVQIYMYGPKSYDNQLAVITHYLHNHNLINDFSIKQAKKYLKEYLEYKFPKIEVTEDVLHDPIQAGLFNDFFQIPFPDPIDYKFTFIDLFAGMGGFRLAMQAQGGKCVFSSEWNPFAQKTYMANFGEMPFGDITKEETKNISPRNLTYCVQASHVSHFPLPEYPRKKVWEERLASKTKLKELCFLMLQRF